MAKKKAITKKLLEIYHCLYKTFGPQHWWPAEEPFEVMVGAILTQSAAWTNVEKAIANLRAARVLSPPALRRLSVDEIAALIRPSGYYNAKARKLKALAEWFGECCQDDIGKLRAMKTDELRKQLLGVWGIGEETAVSIILYAAEKPVFVIDAYTRRIIDRLGITPEKNTYAAYQALFMKNLPADARLFNEYHALLVTLGKHACRKQPVCERCCFRQVCGYKSFNNPSPSMGEVRACPVLDTG